MDRGVRDGRLGSAAAVARGSWHGSRATRADPQQATAIHVRDRTTAGANRTDVHPRRLQRQTDDLAFV